MKYVQNYPKFRKYIYCKINFVTNICIDAFCSTFFFIK
jgi:hypothetical protein